MESTWEETVQSINNEDNQGGNDKNESELLEKKSEKSSTILNAMVHEHAKINNKYTVIPCN
jgi:hypothetical protein